LEDGTKERCFGFTGQLAVAMTVDYRKSFLLHRNC
jgi:hypothetical protein